LLSLSPVITVAAVVFIAAKAAVAAAVIILVVNAVINTVVIVIIVMSLYLQQTKEHEGIKMTNKRNLRYFLFLMNTIFWTSFTIFVMATEKYNQCSDGMLNQYLIGRGN
jgi:hypothetical protein